MSRPNAKQIIDGLADFFAKFWARSFVGDRDLRSNSDLSFVYEA